MAMRHKTSAKAALFATLTLLSACASHDGISDPYEGLNRQTHALNVGIDTYVADPVSEVYGAVVPNPLKDVVVNLADILSTPGNVANDLLQFNIADAAQNTMRFAVNATLGFAGIFDPATSLGLKAQNTDFGETLAVWGVGEGNYLMLPILGPSTARDAVGTVVDWVFDPVGQLVQAPDMDKLTGVRVAKIVDDRDRYADLVEGVLYESADSYVILRLTYLDNRRFSLADGDAAAEAYDIYEDFYE